MYLPRWTVYPAIAVLVVVTLIALPRGGRDPHRGTAQEARNGALLPAFTFESAPVVHLEAWLPEGYSEAGDVDYRAEVQAALEAACGGRLVLPDFPVLVRPAAGEEACLAVGWPVEVVGTRASELRCDRGGTQLLRAEGAGELSLTGFSLRGAGGDGRGPAYGLLQVVGGEHVHLVDLGVSDTDGDGIAIAGATDVVVSGCDLERCSRAALRISTSDGVVVEENRIEAFGGHVTRAGRLTGAGIELVGCSSCSCRGNTIGCGVGVGILLTASAEGPAPYATDIEDNHVADVANANDPDHSGGIHCRNESADTDTQTRLARNRVQRCGAFGVYVERHDGCRITTNQLVSSGRTGLVLSDAGAAEVTGNLILESEDRTGILLLGACDGLYERGNVVRGGGEGAEELCPWSAQEPAQDDRELRTRFADGPPAEGTWRQGEMVYDSTPELGGPTGWICVQEGCPGAWAPFGSVE